jgi:lipopolysaccharide/colanic/teichoic acid biosynthesis glycosyltransferase
MTSLDLATDTFAPRPRARRAGFAHLPHVPAEKGRRALNVAVAAMGLVVAAPLMAVIAAAIKLTSPGPALYRQTRIGIDRRKRYGGNSRRVVDLGGQPFTIYKFRTMAVSGSGKLKECWASPDDPRVTPLGRILRKFRLDELPQLYNVLCDDMNVVGPRPEQPTIFAMLRDQIPGYHVRQRVRPGITGWAQINGHYDACVDDVKRKLVYDAEYVLRQSLVEDLKIMLKTVPTVALRRGAW